VIRGLKEDAEALQRRFYKGIEAKEEAVLMLSIWGGFKDFIFILSSPYFFNKNGVNSFWAK